MLDSQAASLASSDLTDGAAAILGLIERPVALLGDAVGLFHRSAVSVESGPLFVRAKMRGAAGLADTRHDGPLSGDALREAVHATGAHALSWLIDQPGTLSNPRKQM